MIVKFSGSPSLCNTYFIGEEGKPCILVDPGDNRDNRLDRYIDAHHSSLSSILLTHGHYDHIIGLTNLKHRAKIYIGEGDERCLNDDKYNLLPGLEITGFDVETLVDGERLSFLDLPAITAIATPFHTEGSFCFYIEKEATLLSGDTLFHLSYGRTDLPGGDEHKIASSLSKLRSLPPATKIYPGHGEKTMLENELRFNPGFKLR